MKDSEAMEAADMVAAKLIKAGVEPGSAGWWFRAGGLTALRRYAHWKDGMQFVGTCGTTLAAAERKWLGKPDIDS